MKIWEFAKVNGSSIKVDSWMSDTMGLVDGGCVYSTLFKHPAAGPKDYEIILSVFPQETSMTAARRRTMGIHRFFIRSPPFRS